MSTTAALVVEELPLPLHLDDKMKIPVATNTADTEKISTATAAKDEQPSEAKIGNTGNGGVEPEQTRSKLETALLMSALSLAILLVALDQTIVTTALPSISNYFHSSEGYGWIGSVYMLANAASSPIWAKMSDIWGRKPLLLCAIAVFFLGSLLCGLSVSMIMLILSRALQGVGGGGLGILVSICISDVFSMRERPVYFGIIGMTWSFAGATGPLLGGVLTTKLSWKWCFFINCILKVHTPKTPMIAGLKAVDWLGSATVVAGAVLFLLGLQMGGVIYPWSSPIVISCIAAGIVFGVVFVILEWKVAKYPLMPLRIFNSRGNVAALGVAVFHSMTLIGASYFLPLYFQGVLGASPLLSGVYLLPLALSLSVMSSSIGFVVRGSGRYLTVMRASTLVMTLGFGLFNNLESTYQWPKIILYQVIAGFGLGANFQLPLVALQANTPQGDHASAISAYNFLRNLGVSVSIAVGTVLFQNKMQSQQIELVSMLGVEIAQLLTGASAAANVEIINALPEPGKTIAQGALNKGILEIWIFYVSLSVCTLISSFLVQKSVLRTEHKMTETGLDAQEANRVSMLEQEKVRKQVKG